MSAPSSPDPKPRAASPRLPASRATRCACAPRGRSRRAPCPDPIRHRAPPERRFNAGSAASFRFGPVFAPPPSTCSIDRKGNGTCNRHRASPSHLLGWRCEMGTSIRSQGVSSARASACPTRRRTAFRRHRASHAARSGLAARAPVLAQLLEVRADLRLGHARVGDDGAQEVQEVQSHRLLELGPRQLKARLVCPVLCGRRRGARRRRSESVGQGSATTCRCRPGWPWPSPAWPPRGARAHPGAWP